MALLLFAMAIFLRGWWLPMVLRPLLMQQLSSQARVDLQYTSLETDGWRFLEIQGITLQAQDEEPWKQASVGRLRVEFNLFDVWRLGMDGIHSISLEEVAVATEIAKASTPAAPQAAPLTLTWLPDWWDRLPPVSIQDLSWNDQGKELCLLDQVLFLGATALPNEPVLQIDGPSLQLAAVIALTPEELLVDLNLPHLHWDPKWQGLLPASLPQELQASASAHLSLRVPLSAPTRPIVSVEDLALVGTQAGAQWEARARSVGELPQEWMAAASWRAWRGEFRFQTDDWPRFASAWNLPLETPAELGQLQTVDLEVRYADGTCDFPTALMATSRLLADASHSQLTLSQNADGWLLGIPRLQLSASAEQDFPLADGRILPAGYGSLLLQSLQGIPLGHAPLPPMQMRLEEFAWQSKDGSQWLRQEEPMQVAYSPEGLTIPRWRLNTPAGSLKLMAQLPLASAASMTAEDRPWSASLASEQFDIAALQLLPGVPPLPVTAGTMQGVVTLEGSQAAPEFHGQWALHNLQLPPEQRARGFPALFDLDLAFHWDATGLALRQGHYQDAAASLDLSGQLSLPLLDLQDADHLRQEWKTLPLQLQGSAAASDQSWLADLLPEAAPLRGGHLALRFAAQGPLGDPQVQAQLNARDWQPQEALATKLPPGPLAFEIAADWKQQDLAIQSTWHVGERELAQIHGELRQLLKPTADIALSLTTASLQPDWLGWQGLTELQAQLTGDGSDWTLDAQLDGKQLVPPATDEEHRLPPIDLTAALHWDKDNFQVMHLQAQGPRLRAQASAALDLPLRPGSWSELDFAALPLQASLSGQIDALDWLATLPSLRRAQGQLGFHADAKGSLGAPAWSGQLDFEQGAFRLTNPGLPSLEALELHATLDQDGLRFHDSHGELGAAPFTLAGSMQPQPDGSLLSAITLHGEDLLLYRTSGVKIRADSDLTIQGTWPQLTVGGSLAFQDSRVVQNIPLLRSPIGPPHPPSPSGLTLFRLAPPLDQLTFALDLRAEQGILLRSNLARGRLRPELRLEGTGAVPILRGEVFLDDVSMALPATRLYLQPSVARFLEDDPFHPRLNLFGRSSLQGYDVQVVVTGPYDQPQVLLSSTPPLTETDLLVLLTTGQPPADRLDRRAAAGTAALYLARDFLTTFFGSDSVDAEESLLDRLEINFGRDQTRNGVETLNGRLRLRDDVLREGDSLYLEGGRDAFEDFFLGLEFLLRFP